MRSFAILLIFAACAALSGEDSSCGAGTAKELPEGRQKRFAGLLGAGMDTAAIRYDMALAYAGVGNHGKALANLTMALKDSPWLDPAAEGEFKRIAHCAAFQALVRRIEGKYPPVAAAGIAFTAGTRDLIPEGLAADPADGSFYLSSIYHRKILKLKADGAGEDFVREGQDGLLSVLGIRVDARDRSVWAASERGGESALFHFDAHGALIAKYAPAEKGRHLFNDIVVLRNGTAFVTDSEDGSIYKLAPGTEGLKRIDLGGRLYPNGIASSADDKTVFVAHAFGIVALDAETERVAELRAPAGISLAMIDGLYFWRGNLVAIQNGFGPNRIVLLRLRADRKAVTGGRLLEFRSGNLELPTTGAIVNDSFYYIVNSQIDHEQDGRLKSEEQLQPARIAVLRLTRE